MPTDLVHTPDRGSRQRTEASPAPTRRSQAWGVRGSQPSLWSAGATATCLLLPSAGLRGRDGGPADSQPRPPLGRGSPPPPLPSARETVSNADVTDGARGSLTCTGTTGRTRVRSTGPGRWPLLERGRAHTAA